MKFLILVFVLGGVRADPVGLFTLNNGDVIAGENVVLKEKTLQLFAPTLDARVELDTERLLGWHAARISASEPSDLSRIFLRNGDQLDVHVAGIDEEWVEFITAWGLRNAVHVANVDRLELPGAHGEVLYRGPQPLSDFSVRNAPAGPASGWVEAGGGVYTRAENKSRLELGFQDLPDAFRIFMDVESLGSTNLALDLVGRRPRAAGPNWIYLRQRGNRILVNARSRTGSFPTGDVAIRENHDGSYQVEMFVDVKTNRYLVRWNGQRIREYQDVQPDPDEEFAFDALWLQFVGAAPVKIRELTVTRWDGIAPADFAPRQPDAGGVEVRFRNQDRGIWKTLRLQDEKLTVADGQRAGLSFPLSVVSEITFPAPDAGRASRPKPMVSIQLGQPGNRLGVSELEINSGMVEAEHSAFRDPLLLPLDRIQGIQWLSRSREKEVAASSDELRMLSGERVTGFARKTVRGRLRFQPLWAENEFAVPIRNIGTLSFSGEESVEASPHRFFFHNQDWFRGRLLSVDDEEITFRSAWGEDLRVDRGGLREISISEDGEGQWVYRWGREEDWHVRARGSRTLPSDNPGTSTARGNVIYSRRLPNRPNRLVLDLTWEANESPGLLFNLFASDSAGGFSSGGSSDGVQVNVSSNRILARVRGQADFVLFERKPDVAYRLQMFFDPEADKIHLFLNQEPLAVLNIPIPVDMEARWMGFQSTSKDYTPAIFQVQPWEGEPDPDLAVVESPNGDELRLGGNRLRWGRLLPAPEGRLKLATEKNPEPLDFAIDEMQSIRFSDASKFLPRRTARDAQIFLRGESQPVTLAVERLDRTQLIGKSDVWAFPVTLPRAYVQSITFNPYQTNRQDREEPGRHLLTHNPHGEADSQ
ncbi:MAG: hypothetical protein JJU29_14795 [Verrucomicrobia bacterium]|nr:hypothetical protein [Verrucomicrobiota bacterium]MCH8510233.1 hypothetical protein [Kiritimatiellia bacterium]